MFAQASQPRTRTSTILILITLAVVALLLADGVLAQSTIGYVLNLHGDWVVNNYSQTLKVGSPLPAKGRVQVRSPSEDDFIEIADRRGRVIINKSCYGGACRESFRLPPKESDTFSQIFEVGIAILFNDPARFTVLISRGGELREAVVKVSGEQAELSSVMANKGSGRYCLRFVPKSADAATKDAPQLDPVCVDWDANKLLPVSVKNLTPGLYEVQLLNSQDMEPEGPGTEAWVLFVRPERFDEAARSFKEATTLVNSWGRSTRTGTKRQFLRGFLAYLDEKER